jgi:hypothetical protein
LPRTLSDREVAKGKLGGCDPRLSGQNTEISGIAYCNTGDWVENCTAFVEHDAGVLELVNYFDEDRDVETPDHPTVSVPADADWSWSDDVDVTVSDGEPVGV